MKRNCIICGKKLEDSERCPQCGFDLSQCRELYPTLTEDELHSASLSVVRSRFFEQAAVMPRQSLAAPDPEPVPTQKTEPTPRTSPQKPDEKADRTPVQEPSKKKKAPKLLIAAALLVLLGVGGWMAFGSGAGSPSSQSNGDGSKAGAGETDSAISTEANHAGELHGNETASREEENPPTPYPAMDVALITNGYSDVNDHGFNQAAYEAAAEWCDRNGAEFSCYMPNGDSDAERVEAIERAVVEGRNVLLLPGYEFASAIAATVDQYPDVKFIALDCAEWDLQDARGTSDDFSWVYPDNLYAAVYREELAGYLAGVAAVKLGYTKLGFLGGMAVPAVVRYGYGFVQGADDAAAELGKTGKVSVNHAYGNQFFGDPDITAYLERWYGGGTEIVLSCGGAIYTSVGEAAAKTGGKIIGIDVDQAETIDAWYGSGMTVTSAMKDLSGTVQLQLEKIRNGSFRGGMVETLDLVKLSDHTQWAEGFHKADYEALMTALKNGSIYVSSDILETPSVKIRVDYQGNIK